MIGSFFYCAIHHTVNEKRKFIKMTIFMHTGYGGYPNNIIDVAVLNKMPNWYPYT